MRSVVRPSQRCSITSSSRVPSTSTCQGAPAVVPHGFPIALDKIEAERDVKPKAFLAFDDKVTSREILGV